MTVICGGGSSSAKPGFGASLYIGPAALGALLNNVPVAWAVPLAAYLAAITYDLATFCSTDPPSVPVITAADALALLSFDPIARPTAVAKFEQLIGAYTWFQVCKCDAIATPAPPAAPAAPVGLPQINPPIGTPLPATPCWDKQANGLSGGTLAVAKNITNLVAPPGTTHSQNNTGIAGLATALPLPLPTSITVTMAANAGGGTDQLDWTWIFCDSTGAQIGGNSFRLNPSTSFSVNQAIPPATVYWAFAIDEAGSPATLTGNIRLQVWCGGESPTSVAAPCCPPDPLLTGMLSQILQLVTLLQRQVAPFAFIHGATHAALSGNGQFAVQGLMGLAIAVTTVPGRAGLVIGDPNTTFDVGWVNVGTTDGWVHRERITSNPWMVFPDDMGAMTLVGYSIPADVVVTITELKREP